MPITPIENTYDIIDSRNVLERIEDLETEILLDDDRVVVGHWPDETTLGDLPEERLKLLAESEACSWGQADELIKLRVFCQELADNSGDRPSDGIVAIRDSYFEEYAQELAEDLGMLANCDKWPATCIDWTRAARELQYDYSATEFDGVTYWVR